MSDQGQFDKVDALKRYSLVEDDEGYALLEPRADGKWVKFSDVSALSADLRTKPSAMSLLKEAYDLTGKASMGKEWYDAATAVLSAHSQETPTDDPGTEKLLRAMLDRAYKMMLQAGYRVAEVNPDHNDPIIAWMSDARAVLYGSGRQPDLGSLT